jgi:hypothetical protein
MAYFTATAGPRKTKPPFGLPAIAWHTEQGLKISSNRLTAKDDYLFFAVFFFFLAAFFLAAIVDLL